MKQIIVVVCLALAVPAFAKTVAEPETTVIDSEQMLGECLISVQRQYFPVCLPSLSARLLQPAGSFPVDWEGFDSDTRALFSGWIDERGVVRYTVGLYEDYWTGEIVVLDDSGWEMFRIPREKTYDPYDLQREFFNLGKKEVLEDEFTREIFLPSKISTLADLVPLVFWDAHVQFEQEAAMVPMMMAMASSSGGGSEKPTATMTLGSNDMVTLHITVPEGEDWRYLQIFKKDDLVYSTTWTLCESWLPTYGNTNISWQDSTSPGNSEGFFHISNAVDSDGDGRSDLYEAWSGTSSNTFNFVDTENGGSGDGMHDWWEEKLFGGLSQDGGDDFDSDGILNSNELVFVSVDQPPVMVTDPSQYSSDGDALSDMEMFDSPPTDPWNPDASPPVATISWPTNNTVLVF